MICQQLQRDGVDDGRHRTVDRGDVDHLQVVLRDDVGGRVGEHQQFAAARAHFLDVGFEFGEQAVVGRDRDDRHVGVHQRQWPVLQLAGRIRLRVDVGNLFEFERAFERDGIVRAAPEKQRVLFVGKLLGDVLNQRLERERLFHLGRQLAQLGDETGFVFFAHVETPPERDDQQAQCRQLGGECFGRRHADFRARVGHQREVGCAHERTLGRIANRQAARKPLFFGDFQRGQGVDGLARLRQRHHQAVSRRGVHPRPKFARDFHPAGHAVSLEPIRRDQPGVITAAAGDDVHRAGALKQRGGVDPEAFLQQAHAGDAPFQSVGDGCALFVDFLQHVVAVVAQFDRVGRQRTGAHFARLRASVRIADGNVAALDVDDVAVFEDVEIARHRHQRAHVGGDGGAAVWPNSDHQRRAAAGADQAVRLVRADHADGECAFEHAHRRLDRFQQVQPVAALAVNLIERHFGVGVGGELIAVGPLGAAQRFVVFDDAVAHQREGAAADMRMGVDFGRRAVGRPAGVSDAGGAAQGLAGGQRALQFGDFADAADAPKTLCGGVHRGVDDGHAGRVIAAVFEPLQPVQQYRQRVFIRPRPGHRHCSYDAAHAICPRAVFCSGGSSRRAFSGARERPPGFARRHLR